MPRSPSPRRTRRRRMMACTTSIGPGATNMVTAAAVAHVNRLPVLFLPGDVFASRRPDPVLQQIEDFGDGTVSANDCFRPVSRYFDRITRPEQLLAGPAARHARADRSRRMRPGDAGAAAGRAGRGLRLSRELLSSRVWTAAPRPARRERACRAAALLRKAKKPLDRRRRRRAVSRGRAARSRLSPSAHGIPVAETQAGKGALPGIIRSTWARSASPAPTAANALARGGRPGAGGRHAAAGLHHRLARAVRTRAKLVGLNVAGLRCRQASARMPLVADARRRARGARRARSADWQAPAAWTDARAEASMAAMDAKSTRSPPRRNAELPTDAQVIGAVQRAARPTTSSWSAPRAGCRASCTSCGATRARRLSPRVRLLLHGLRDRRRPRREDGAARARGRRDGRRRQLPDDEFRDRDLGHARHQAHHRRARQPRLSAASTACSAPPAARASTTCSRDAEHETLPRDRFRGACAQPRRARREGRRHSAIWKRRCAKRRRRHARPWSSSTPTRCGTTEAGGGWWDVAVPEVSERGRGARGAQHYEEHWRASAMRRRQR